MAAPSVRIPAWSAQHPRASGVVSGSIAIFVVVVIHAAALIVLMQQPINRTISVRGNVTSVRILPRAESNQALLSPLILSFKKPEPVVWRPVIETAAAQKSSASLPMVLMGPRLSPDFPIELPASVVPADIAFDRELVSLALSLQILEDGRVGDVVIEKNSGYQSLDMAVVEHVKNQWRFQPALRDGVPFTDWKNVLVEWHSDGAILRW